MKWFEDHVGPYSINLSSSIAMKQDSDYQIQLLVSFTSNPSFEIDILLRKVKFVKNTSNLSPLIFWENALEGGGIS